MCEMEMLRGSGTLGIRCIKGLIRKCEWGTWEVHVQGSGGTFVNGRCNMGLVFLRGLDQS